MMNRKILQNGLKLLAGEILFTCFVFSQVPADHDALLNGEGMGMAAYAEVNGYPGPKHVLDLANDLQLSPPQKKAIQDVYDQTKTRAKELGERIVSVEEELNQAFAAGLVSDKSIRETVDQIEKLRARLRTVHYAAHLKTRSLLTTDQLEVYKRLQRAGSKAGH